MRSQGNARYGGAVVSLVGALGLALCGAPAGSAGAATATGSERPASCRPEVLDLGTLPGGRTSEILAGNRNGVLVGGARTAADRERAVRWVHGTIADLGAGSEAWAADVNESGVIVGNMRESGEPGTSERAFVWRSGRLRVLPGLGGATFVRRINDADVATGSAYAGDGSERPVVWKRGVLHRLSMPTGYDGAAGLGINDVGDVVGLAYTQERAQAWLWRASGAGRPLDRLGGFSQANVLTDTGSAFGISDFGGRPGGEATMWPHPGTVRGLGHLRRGDVSFALGANNAGDAVGISNYRPGGGNNHVLLVSRYRPASTLLPLSGDVADQSGAHYVSEVRPVSVGGSSATRSGQVHATLWKCAWLQSFVPPDSGTGAGPMDAETRKPLGDAWVRR